jgi:hypothetical protein
MLATTRRQLAAHELDDMRDLCDEIIARWNLEASRMPRPGFCYARVDRRRLYGGLDA